MKLQLSLVVLSLGLAGSAVAGDLTIVYKVVEKGQASTATTYLTNERMRTGGPTQEMIVEYGPGRMVSIDHKSKEYSETTFAEMQAQMKAMSDRMEQQMAGMPPAVREMMASKMGGGGTMAITVTKGTATRQVAGYACTPYTVTMGTFSTMESCNCTALPVPVPALKARNDMVAAMNAMNPALRSSMGKLTEEMKKVEGYPLTETTRVTILGKTSETSKEATEIKTGPIPASAFAIPAGYKKVPSPLSKAAAR